MSTDNNTLLSQCERLDSYSTDELYVMLLGHSNRDSLGVAEDELRRLVAKGKNMLRDSLEKIRSNLCANTEFRSMIRHPAKYRRAEVAAVIADALLATSATPPVCIPALIIAREFASSLCDD